MKKILSLLLVALVASCSLPDSGGLENLTNSGIKTEPIITEPKKDSIILNRPLYVSNAVPTGLMYFFKGSNGNTIYRSIKQNACTTTESIGVLGNSATSPHGPAATIFNGKIYLFHKGVTGHLIYYSSSSDGINWSTDKVLGNGAATIGSVSATVFDNRIFVAHKSALTTDRKIYISSSSNGVSWGSEIAIDPSNNSNICDPWIFTDGSTLFLYHSKTVYPYRHIMSSTDGVSWANWSNGPGVSDPSSNLGFSVAFAPNGTACIMFVDYNYEVRFSYSYDNLLTWSVPVKVKTPGGINSQSSERPVVVWRPASPTCAGGFEAIFKGKNNNTLYRAKANAIGQFIEDAQYIGTTTHGPYMIAN